MVIDSYRVFHNNLTLCSHFFIVRVWSSVGDPNILNWHAWEHKLQQQNREILQQVMQNYFLLLFWQRIPGEKDKRLYITLPTQFLFQAYVFTQDSFLYCWPAVCSFWSLLSEAFSLNFIYCHYFHTFFLPASAVSQLALKLNLPCFLSSPQNTENNQFLYCKQGTGSTVRLSEIK